MALFQILATLCLIIAGTIAFLSFLAITFYARYQKHFRILKKARKDKPGPQDGPDVIIVGGGVIGSAMATVLARDGRRVTVIERSMKPPDRFVGEGMLASGMKTMKELDINISKEDVDGTLIDQFVLHPTPKVDSVVFPLVSKCLMCTNGNLVDTLRKMARAESRCNFIEGTVTCLCEEDGIVTGVEYQEKEGRITKKFRAPLTILADGAYSRFRAINISKKPQLCNYSLALELDMKMDSTMASTIGILPTSLGVFVPAPLSDRKMRIYLNTNTKLKKEDLQKIEDEIPECWSDIYKKAVELSTIRTVPVFYLPPLMKHKPGVITIGDANSIRNPITASGMTVGMNDIMTWKNLLKDIPDLHNYQAMFAAENIFAFHRKQYCFVLDLLGWCLGKFFLPTTDGLKLLGNAFGEYSCTIKEDYTNMYIGTDTRPQLLLYHLTKVTMITMKNAVRTNGLKRLPLGIYQALQALWSACACIIPVTLDQIRSMIVTK